MEKIFKADIKEIYNVGKFLNESISGTPARKHEIELNIVLEEMFTNIAMYAYEGKTDIPKDQRFVLIDIDSRADGSIAIRLEDRGYPFNPLLKPEPDMELYIRNRFIGGLGIKIVRKKMDNLIYRYEDGKNILIMEKNYSGEN